MLKSGIQLKLNYTMEEDKRAVFMIKLTFY